MNFLTSFFGGIVKINDMHHVQYHGVHDMHFTNSLVVNVNDEKDVLFAYAMKRQGPQMVVVVIMIDSIKIK